MGSFGPQFLMDDLLPHDLTRCLQRWKVVPHVDVLQSYPTKVAFRMAVYFNCRRIVEGLSSVPESLANIRARLDRSGPTLSSDPDLIAYFALPFVRNPKAHPTFRHLFHPDGWARLRKDLIGYLLSLRFSGAFASPLGRLVAQGGHAGATEEDHPPPSSETDSEELRRSLAEVTRKHQTLRRDYQKLMGRIGNRNSTSYLQLYRHHEPVAYFFNKSA